MATRDEREYARKRREIEQEYRARLEALNLVYGVRDAERAFEWQPPKALKVPVPTSGDVEVLTPPNVSIELVDRPIRKRLPVVRMARQALDELGAGTFTVHDLRDVIRKKFGQDAPLSNLSHFLKRQALGRLGVHLIKKGVGSTASLYAK